MIFRGEDGANDGDVIPEGFPARQIRTRAEKVREIAFHVVPGLVGAEVAADVREVGAERRRSIAI